MSIEPIMRIDPSGVYRSQDLQAVFGDHLWREISRRLPRLGGHRVLGEDLLRVLREASDRDQRRRVDMPDGMVRREPSTKRVRGGGEKHAKYEERRPLRISDDLLARAESRAAIPGPRRHPETA